MPHTHRSQKKGAKTVKGHSHRPLRFPDGFLWGTSTSAYQVEGGNRWADWWQWEQEGGHIANDETSGRAADHYHRYDEDFAIAESFHMNAHRLSLEWSRLEPKEGVWSKSAERHYRDVLRSVHAHKQRVMVTLYHFTMPTWLAERGGWLAPDAVKLFIRFVNRVTEAFGDLVDEWITVNEPLIVTLQGSVLGIWPPNHRSYREGWLVFRALAAAHREAYAAIHAWARKREHPARVGMANSLISLASYRKHSLYDTLSVWMSDKLWNHEFYRQTPATHDFLGVNYYFHQRVEGGHGALPGMLVDIRGENREMSDIGWEIYPAGIFDVLLDLRSMRLPIYITENGIAAVNDDRRVRLIVAYMKEIYHAIQAGVDIRGYYHWSLLDNFEWDKGFAPQFGLVGFDKRTMERKPKRSFSVYGKMAKENAISHEMLRYLGHGVL